MENQFELPSYVTPEYLASLHLRHGVGTGKDGDRCAIQEVRAWLGEDAAKDEIPDCVSRPLGRFAIRLNDSHAIAREPLAPHLPKLIGTRGRVDEQKIAFRMADMAVRVWAAAALEARGRKDDAAKLRALAPIVDRGTALKGRAADAYAAAADAYAAAADAYAAAADAADAYAAAADARRKIYTEAVALLVELCEAA